MLYLFCYYIRLIIKMKKNNFEVELKQILLKLVNGETNIDEKGKKTLMDKLNQKIDLFRKKLLEIQRKK